MTVTFGNTPDATVNSARTGLPTMGLIVALYLDAERTMRATGLTDEDGTPSDSGPPDAAGRVPGSTVTSKVGGMLSFGAPDGTLVLYYDRGDGISSAIFPQAQNGPGVMIVYALDNDDLPRPGGTGNPAVVQWGMYPGHAPTNLLRNHDQTFTVDVERAEPTNPTDGIIKIGRYVAPDPMAATLAEGDRFPRWTDTGTAPLVDAPALVAGLYHTGDSDTAPYVEFGNGSELTRYATATFGPYSQPGWVWAMVRFTSLAAGLQAILGPTWGLWKTDDTSGNPVLYMRSSSAPKGVTALSTAGWVYVAMRATAAGAFSRLIKDGATDQTQSPGTASLTQFIVGGLATTGGAQQLEAYVGGWGFGVAADDAHLPSLGYFAAQAAWAHARWAN